jgi:predicted transcriptional regulator
MAEKKQSLSNVLNVRVDDALSREIDRIAKVQETSASEAARKLIGFGVAVQRQVEASYLRLPYELDRETTEGRVVITADWKPYTQREIWDMEDEARAAMYEAEDYGNR